MAKKKRASFEKKRIDHGVYGRGTIVDVDDRYTTIRFDDAKTRKFVTSLVEFEPTDTAQPTKPRRRTTVSGTKEAADEGHEPNC